MGTIGIVDIMRKINEQSGAGGVRDIIIVMVKNVECKFLAIILAVVFCRDVRLMIKTSLPESLKCSLFANLGQCVY